MEVWKFYLEIAGIISWFTFVIATVVSSYAITRLVISTSLYNQRVISNREAIVRLEEFLPSLREREVELTETIRTIREQSQYLSQLMEHVKQVDVEKGTGGAI